VPVTREKQRDAVHFNDDFTLQTEQFRKELLAYCYRLVGSVHDAEDLVQETYMNAWRSYGGFEGRATLRTWLYRIATRVCLKALERQPRRPLPSGLYAPSHDADERIDPEQPETNWIQPFPNRLLAPAPADPAVIVQARQSVRLALVAALQHLPPRQRAVLILREVLGWQANEVAGLLGTSTAAVNSALQRARTQLMNVEPAEDEIIEPTDMVLRSLLDRYAAAFENADVAALESLLTEDATWEMPPIPTWFAGRSTIAAFLAGRLTNDGGNRMVPTGANGQPAFALYLLDRDGTCRAHAVHLLTVTARGIAKVVAFHDPELFVTFGLPIRLPADTTPDGPVWSSNRTQ
jgi:RNA polymerase sigma-70 factor (ECF subfamily)